MPVELRKRKARDPPPAPPPKKAAKGGAASAGKVKKAAAKGAEEKEPAKKNGDAAAAAATAGAPKVGDVIELEGFGGTVQTNDGEDATLAKLVEESDKGVVLFTYPKASTPGCTTQVCLFRDNYDDFTKAGFSIYGLSADSTKANTTFKTKKELQYPLLCDPQRTLIAAIGLRKNPSGTQRGLFVVDKKGKVLAAQPGSPAGTVDVVKKLVEEEKTGETNGDKAKEE